jgi:integrase
VVKIKGRFYARWTVEGKRVYGEPRDSYEEADRDRVNARPYQPPQTSRRDIPTVQEWAHRMQDGAYGKRIARSTFDTQETIRLLYIEGKPFGALKVHRVSRHHCQEWVDGIGKSPSYTRRCAAFVSRLFTLAVEHGYILANPMKGIRLPNVEERDNRTLSPQEAVRILNPTTRTDAVMLVAMHTGMRRGELVRLEWSHVGKDAVKVPGTKSRHSKASVPLTPEAYDAIMAQPRRSRYVFTTEQGKPLSPRNLSRDVNARKKALGLPAEMRLQDLRGSYVSLLIENGADIRTVMELARHGDVRTTMKAYARSRETVRRDAVEALRKAITVNPEDELADGHKDVS